MNTSDTIDSRGERQEAAEIRNTSATAPMKTGHKQPGVMLGYMVVLASALLTLLDAGLVALVVEAAGIGGLARLASSASDAVPRQHLWSQFRSLLLLFSVMGGLYLWLFIEFYHSNSSEGLWEAIIQHWILHTSVSVLLGIYVLVKTVRGILRYTDNR